MKQYSGNYLGLCINNDDPEKRGRVQVFIPHIMPALFEDWNDVEADIQMLCVGDNLPSSLTSGMRDKLMAILPWAESALPIIGPCAPGNLVPQTGGNFYNQSPTPNPESIQGGGFVSGTSLGGLNNNWAGSLSKLNSLLPPGAWNPSSTKRPRQTTASGGTSDHWTGSDNAYAVDLGLNSSFNGDTTAATNTALNIVNNIQSQLGRPLYNSWGEVGGFYEAITPDGYRAQVIWQSNVGGNHYDHIHFGIKNNNFSANNGQINTTLPQGNTPTQIGYERAATTGHYAGGVAFESNPVGSTDSYRWNNIAYPEVVNNGGGIPSRAGVITGSNNYDRVIPSNIDSSTRQALTEVAQTNGIAPAAIAMVINTESGWNTQAQSPGGTYRGLTQIGEQTFTEAGGSLGGLTWSQYLNASPAQQIYAYGDWLRQYNFSSKLQQNNINFSNLTIPQQAAFLQGFQFAPNGTSWQQAFAQGNYNIATTNSPQASFLGSTSIADMVRYYGGDVPVGSLTDNSNTLTPPMNMVQNPDPHGITATLDLNNMASGAFSYPAVGAMLWCFFREGNPLFPVYFAASYGQREWQSAYRYPVTNNGAEPGPGYKPSTADGNPIVSHGGVTKYGRAGAIRWEDTIDPTDATKDEVSLMITGGDGSNMFFNLGYHQIFSKFDRRDQVDGDRWQVTMGSSEKWNQGHTNEVYIGDRTIIHGNITPEVIQAHDNILQSLHRIMEPLKEPKNKCQQGPSNPNSSLPNPGTINDPENSPLPDTDREIIINNDIEVAPAPTSFTEQEKARIGAEWTEWQMKTQSYYNDWQRQQQNYDINNYRNNGVPINFNNDYWKPSNWSPNQ